MHRLRQSLQSIIQFDNALEEAHRFQAVRLRSLRKSFPAQSRSATSQRDSTHGVEADRHLVAIWERRGLREDRIMTRSGFE